MGDEKTDPGASSEELVAIAQSSIPGDTRAFRALVERHKEHVLANCRFLSGSPTDAEDLAQEVFIKVYAALDRFENRSKFSTWMERIKINHCISHLRRERGRRFIDIQDPKLLGFEELRLPVSADSEAAQISDRDRVRDVLASLPDSLRIPLVMCDVDGLAYQEIADALGIGLSATKMRIKRAREMFRGAFRKSSATPGRTARRRATSSASDASRSGP